MQSTVVNRANIITSRTLQWSCKYSSCRKELTLHSRRYSSAVDAHDIFDVVCVGGGPAGLSLLSALRSSPNTSNLKVALVESQDLDRVRQWRLPPGQYSNRVSSLTPSSVSFLQEIGAWKHVQSQRVQPYSEMQVWDGLSDSRISFDWPQAHSREQLHDTIAYMCENLNLTSGLLSRIQELGGVSLFDKTKVEHIGFGGNTASFDMSAWPIVHLTGGKQLAARLLVGADGFNSPVRAFAGIASRGWDYERHGVVATVELATNQQSRGGPVTAYQRFLPTGPAALLPLPNNLATLVWSTLPSHAALLKRLSPPDLLGMINAAFRLSSTDLAYMHELNEGQSDEYSWRKLHTDFNAALIPQEISGVQEGSLASFPLRMRHADTYIGPRVALVGDAAHTVHPLAGQGLNQGQGDIQSLARTLESAVQHGQDIGDPLSLEPYMAQRYSTNNALLGVVDKLHKLYAVESGPLVPLRSIGLSMVNALEPLKTFFMQQAAGK